MSWMNILQSRVPVPEETPRLSYECLRFNKSTPNSQDFHADGEHFRSCPLSSLHPVPSISLPDPARQTHPPGMGLIIHASYFTSVRVVAHRSLRFPKPLTPAPPRPPRRRRPQIGKNGNLNVNTFKVSVLFLHLAMTAPSLQSDPATSCPRPPPPPCFQLFAWTCSRMPSPPESRWDRLPSATPASIQTTHCQMNAHGRRWQSVRRRKSPISAQINPAPPSRDCCRSISLRHADNKKHHTSPRLAGVGYGAHERTRTSTRLLSLEPESSASTNSATCAQGAARNHSGPPNAILFFFARAPPPPAALPLQTTPNRQPSRP